MDIITSDLEGDGDQDILMAMDNFGASYSVVLFENCLYTLCPADINGDGAVNSADLVVLLAEFGCNSNCGADITIDDVVNSADLVVLLAAFGGGCE